MPAGAALIVVSSESLLLAVLLSVDDDVTLAELVSWPDAVGDT